MCYTPIKNSVLTLHGKMQLVEGGNNMEDDYGLVIPGILYNIVTGNPYDSDFSGGGSISVFIAENP